MAHGHDLAQEILASSNPEDALRNPEKYREELPAYDKHRQIFPPNAKPLQRLLSYASGYVNESRGLLMKTYKDYITETEEKIRLQEGIPLVIAGLGAAWSAYDAWKLKQAYDRGEISIEALVKQVGTDVAITIAGGTVAKVGKTGWKYGKKIYNSEKDAMQAVADKVNKRIEPTISSQGSKKLQSPVDKNFDRTQKMSDYGKTGPNADLEIPAIPQNQ